MTTFAVLQPTTLVGQELRQGLEQRRELWSDLRLLTQREEEVGTLVDVRGGAAMVQRTETDSLSGVDVAFFCDDMAANESALAYVEPGTTAVVLSPDAPAGLGEFVVAGVNSEDVRRGEVLVSPHPAVIALAHLLRPLQSLSLKQGIATLLQPVSMRDQAALDEVLNQTRSILTFSDQPTAIFGRQMAFNLLPTPEPESPVVHQLQSVLGGGMSLSLQIIQTGVFHCFGVSLYCSFDEDPGGEAIARAMADHPVLESVEEPDLLGPIDAPARDEILLGPIRNDPGGQGYWIWAVMDNLTRGSAVNALQIVDALF